MIFKERNETMKRDLIDKLVTFINTYGIYDDVYECDMVKLGDWYLRKVNDKTVRIGYIKPNILTEMVIGE